MMPPNDLTGRERITWNVLTSWAGHALYIVAGFLLPRLIDERLGQERLGVWDFAWSFVGYFGLVQAGVVTSINRYVARFRAAGDLDGLNRAVSSVTCVLVVMAALISGLALGAAGLIPVCWAGRLGSFGADAQWTVLLLGAGAAFEVGFSGFAGVLTGCHRWDLHNGIHGLTCVLHTSVMVIVVVLGGGLPALAAAHVGGELVGRLLRIWLAYRVCPGLHVSPRRFHWGTAREMLHFGSKAFIPQVGDLLLNQTINVLILTSLGAAALAVFSRPRALLRHADTLVAKLAFVVAPTTSSLQAAQRLDEVRGLFINSTRYGVYVALPLILGLAILGGPLLRMWMGPEYARGLLVVVLSLGSLAAITQQPVLSTLFGLNAHGKAGLANFAASVAAVGLAYVAIEILDEGLMGAALAVTVPLTVTGGFVVPLLACRRLEMTFARYLARVWWPPVLCCLPFAACLTAARLAFATQPLLAVGAACAVGGPVLAYVYYRRVLPVSLKTAVVGKLAGRWWKRAEGVA